MKCECCGSRHVYRRLDEDLRGRHIYQTVCSRCNHEGEPVEVLHPIAAAKMDGAAGAHAGKTDETTPTQQATKPTIDRLPQVGAVAWGARIALAGVVPAVIWLFGSLVLMVNMMDV